MVSTYNSTWGTNEDDVKYLICIGGGATPKDQLLEPLMFVSIAVETNMVIGPVRVVDLVAGGEDELLVNAGGVTSFEGHNGREGTRAFRLVASIIETEARCGMLDLHAGGQVLELLEGIETAAITHDCRASVVSIHVGTMALDLECKEPPVGYIRNDCEAARGGAREGVGPYLHSNQNRENTNRNLANKVSSCRWYPPKMRKSQRGRGSSLCQSQCSYDCL